MKSTTFLALCFILLIVTSTHADVINIPADTSTIQGGISLAQNGDTVLVADGLYLENLIIDNKSIVLASHYLINKDTSHISNTIIDGSQPEVTDSATTVLIRFNPDTNTVFCGFTVTGGYGTKRLNKYGDVMRVMAGVAVIGSSAIIEDNLITGNKITTNTVPDAYSWSFTGGIGVDPLFFDGVTVIIRNNRIIGNEIISEHTGGGGIAIGSQKRGNNFNFIIENNIIENNIVTNTDDWKAMGGGLSIELTIPTSGNQTIRNNIIRKNKVIGEHSFGGGIYVVFSENNPTGSQDNNPGPYIYNNIISENHSDYSGGGLAFWRVCYPTPTSEPVPLSSMGKYIPKPTFINNTIVNNTAPDGSGIFTMNHIPFLMNDILWNNHNPDAPWGEIFIGNVPRWIENNSYGDVKIQYSDIQGGWNGEGNINYYPAFVNDLFQLSDSSRCIGTGTITYSENGTTYNAPIRDFAGNVRPFPQNSQPDIGAMENTLAYPDIYLEVPSEFETIQSAIDAANDDDIVLVGENIYYENIDFKGKSITVASHFLLDQDTSHISKTIINGSKPVNADKGSVVYFVSGEDTNSVLMGFTITGGTGNSYNIGNFDELDGGGIFIFEAGAKISHNKIINNQLISESRISLGSAIAAGCDSGDFLIIKNNEIRGNGIQCPNGGGAVSMGTNDTIIFCNNLVEYNTTNCSVLASSGGMYIWGGNLNSWGMGIYNGEILVSNNIIRNNSTNAGTSSVILNGGGGIYIDMCSPLLENNLICNNYAEKYGGGVIVLYNTRDGISGNTEPVFINNTITNNSAQLGSGIYAYQSQITMVNNIVWGNHSSQSPWDIYKTNTNRLYFANNNICGWPLNFGYDHGGNFDQNPLFKFPDHGEYELDKYSPCTGAGVASVEISSENYKAPQKDLNGRERPANDVDMGALESKFSKDLNPLVGYWSFDDGTANDGSIYENHGGFYRTLIDSLGVLGNAFYFDGYGYVNIPDDETLDTDTSMTISLWIKPDSIGSQGSKFISKWYSSPSQGDWMFSLSSKDSIDPEFGHRVSWYSYVANYKEFGAQGIGPDTVENFLKMNEWNHIAITFDRGYLCAYLDSVLISDTLCQVDYLSLGEYDETDDIYIGRLWRMWPGYEFYGSIDEVRIYDRALSKEEIYDYYILVTDIDKSDISDKIPDQFILDQNYPNPFNPATTINYQLPITNYVDLSIYNLLGQKVATLVSKRQTPGRYQIKWDAVGFASGVYFYRLSTDNGFVQTKKLILLK